MPQNYLTNSPLPAGTRLGENGRYRIDSGLGDGGFAKTYVATDLSTSRRIAIKELFIKGLCGRVQNSTEVSVLIADNQEVFDKHRRKFHVEAERLKTFDNPHIVRVHDFFEQNGTSYYVMDYIEGNNLKDILDQRHSPLPVAEVRRLLVQLLDALECIHAGGQRGPEGQPLLHLDIKPANILIDRAGNVVVIDFGASKQVHDANGNTITTTDIAAYTDRYAPVELAVGRNVRSLGPWTDIYSLGAVLYRMLTYNELPSVDEHLNNSGEGLVFPPNVDDQMRRLVTWMMQPLSTNRPQNVAQIRQFLDDDEIIVNLEDPEDPGSRKPEQHKPHRRRILIWSIVVALVLAAGGGAAYYFLHDADIPKTIVDDDDDVDDDVEDNDDVEDDYRNTEKDKSTLTAKEQCGSNDRNKLYFDELRYSVQGDDLMATYNGYIYGGTVWSHGNNNICFTFENGTLRRMIGFYPDGSIAFDFSENDGKRYYRDGERITESEFKEQNAELLQELYEMLKEMAHD